MGFHHISFPPISPKNYFDGTYFRAKNHILPSQKMNLKRPQNLSNKPQAY